MRLRRLTAWSEGYCRIFQTTTLPFFAGSQYECVELSTTLPKEGSGRVGNPELPSMRGKHDYSCKRLAGSRLSDSIVCKMLRSA